MSNWQPAGRCLLCNGQLQQARFPSAGYISVRCRGCGSIWNGPIGQAENVAAAASALDQPGGITHQAGDTQARAGHLSRDERSSTRGEVNHA
jgi:hypothetical protein